MDSIYIIYKYTCNINSKSYIGQTKNLVNRERGHRRPSSGCVAFRNAIQKHGWKTFTREIIAENLSLEEANVLEEQYIATHNTLAPHGYNIRSGGLNKHIHPETKRKISLKLKGRKCSAETIEKRRKKMKGRKKSPDFVQRIALLNTGKKRTPEQRERMSQSRQGYVMPEEQKKKISDANKGRKLSETTWPHCGKIGKGNAMVRWHFDVCKYKIGEQ